MYTTDSHNSADQAVQTTREGDHTISRNSHNQGGRAHGTDQAVQTPSRNSFKYTYSDSFGTPDRQGTQDSIDKQVLKALSQNNKESTLSFKSLLKKLRQETYRYMQLDKPQKDNLATNLERTLHSNHATSYRLLPHRSLKMTDKRDRTDSIQESLLLESTQYSDVRTRQEQTSYTLHIHTQVYKEDCTQVPQCSDCTNNGIYSSCDSRQLIKHTVISTLPFNQFWTYVLGTHHKPQ